MGLEAEKSTEASARLIAAGRTLLAQGDAGFSLTRLCAEAGVTLADFRDSFASKAELLQQLMDHRPEAPQAVATPDPWLERRLRVFERALSALEDKADSRERETRHTLARLEERLAELGGVQLRRDVAAAAERAVKDVEASAAASVPAEAAPEDAPEDAPVAEAADAAAPEEPNPLLLAPLAPAPVSRLDMEVLEQARRAAQAHGRRLDKTRSATPRIPERLLIAGTLAILILFACAALTLVNAGAAPRPAGGAMMARTEPVSPLARLQVEADGGNAQAQRKMALAYLNGEGVAKDRETALLWAKAAAEAGDTEAQYLLGSLMRSGAGRDLQSAVNWFAQAAAAGNLKAMHAMGLAHATGLGAARSDADAAAWFAKAAARGYVDSAFNLAVLYERGHGVAQDPQQALRWYRAAAKAGDMSAASRARILAQQVGL